MPLRLRTLDRQFALFCRTGDTEALSRVFDATARELLHVAAWLSGNRADAEDLLQLTFLTAIEGRATFRRQRRVQPWLLGILTNHARNLRRERVRRAALPTQPEPVADPIAQASDAEFAQWLTDTRDAIGAPYAEVLALHLEQGLNAKEIAARLARPAGTVRTQLMRALELLRKRLPSGFVAALAPLLPEGTTLATIKTTVLASAKQATFASTATSATATATLATGGLLMSKKVLVVVPALLLLLAVGLYEGWPAGGMAGAGPTLANAADLPRVDANAVTAASSAQESPPARRLVAATTTADPDPGFAALRVLVRWQDGMPASGVGVGANGTNSAHNERRLAITGADGACLLRHMRPGSWNIAITHASDSKPVVVRAGEPQTCEFIAEVVATLRGRVLDDREQPVADADVWITHNDVFHGHFVVAQSDVDGRFAVPLAVPVQIGACKAKHAPSLVQEIDPRKQPLEEIVLQLRGPGGCVQGTVRDVQGQPIAWARVFVGLQGSMPVPGGLSAPPRLEPMGLETTTDREGRFAVDGMKPGKEVAQAWAPGFAKALQIIEVTTGATPCDFALQKGAVVQGQVRDAAGHGVGDASVLLGEWGEYRAFVSSGTRADADGHYRLVDLPAGRQSLLAHASAHRTSGEVELTVGGTSEWNPVLHGIPDIRGHLLGADDKPVAGMQIYLSDQTGMPAGIPPTVTDAEGRFALQPEAEGSADLAVGEIAAPLKIVENVRAGTEDLVIRLTADDLPSARIHGRVVDDAGHPLAAKIAAARPRASNMYPANSGADGRFAIGPVPAGRYQVIISMLSHGQLPLPEFTLATGADHDLGDIVLQRPGRATITVRDEQGNPTRDFVMLYTQAGLWAASAQTEQGRARFEALQPGHYFVCSGGGPRAAHCELEVQPAAETLADMQVQLVGSAVVKVRDAAKVEGLDMLVFAFADGHLAGFFGSMRGKPQVKLALPPGHYTLDVHASDGRRANSEITIANLEDHPEVMVDLPAR